ncbi:hypothetical protein LTR42_003522 [Elasticomyces elasticus]|nr:hypothetical protein LTR42_003522 [Elasticomyces elasticus]
METTSDTARAEAYAAGASYEISDMQTTLRNLHVLLDTDGPVPAALTLPLVRALEETSTSAQRILTACGKHWENTWKPTERSASVAQRVFCIPELCENILGYLPTNLDIYCAMRTNQGMTAAVRGSPSIQKALGFASAHKGHWYTPFRYDEFRRDGRNHENSFTCYQGFESREQPELATVSANFMFRTPEGTLRGIMAAFRNVQICTPSIREMECHVECCDKWPNESTLGGSDIHRRDWDETETGVLPAPEPINPLKNPKGLTVGDLFKATIRLREEHRLCPYAKEAHVDLESGSVQVHVSFKGQIKLSPDDPVIIALQDPDDGWSEYVPDERDLRYRAQIQMRTGYVKAKTDAEQIETGKDLVDEATDLLRSTTIDGQAAEASSWNE